MTNKPRIAFCFSWQARTLDQTYLFFQKNLFDAAKEQWFDYDVFCAVEDDEDVDKVKLLNPTKVEKIKSSEVEKFIEKKYINQFNNSKNMNEVCYFFDEKYNLLQNKTRVYNLLQQIYKVSECSKLCKDFWYSNKIKYEIVFRLRFDTFFLNNLNFIEISRRLKNNILICNDRKFLFYWKYFYKIEDLFFIWNEKFLNLLWCFFDNFISCLKWDEIAHVKIFKLFCSIESVLIKLKIPVLPLRYIESIFYKIFTPELCYYNYFIKNWFVFIKERFSHILLRKNWKDSYIRIEKFFNVYEK